jgi:tetratricopeptide (TPR) repeat protein
MRPNAAILSVAIVVIGALLVFAMLGSAHPQSASTELNLGTEAFRQARYGEAAQHFEKAVSLEPGNAVAHLYLATAYAQQYIPGVETADNVTLADKGIEQYQKVLDSDAPGNSRVSAAKAIAYLYLNRKKFEEAKWYYQKASGFDAADPEPYYSLGVIDWTLCYQPRMEARARLGLSPEENLNGKIPRQKKVCEELKTKNMVSVADGIENLNKAIELRPDYDDAMAYLNLMYRERADLECDDPDARAKDLETADRWVDKTLAVKKKKFSPQSQEHKQDQSQEQAQPQQK